MKYFAIFALATAALLGSCKDSSSDAVKTDIPITPVKQGTVFTYQLSNSINGVPKAADSMKMADSIAVLDTIVKGKRCIACYDGFGKDGFHYLSYEADGNIAVLIDEGDEVLVKLPISVKSSTTILDTIFVNSGDPDHWIFSAQRIGTEERTIGSRSVTSVKAVVTWQASKKDSPLVTAEIFSYWFAPELGYFTSTSLEYLPVVNGGADAVGKRELIDWK